MGAGSAPHDAQVASVLRGCGACCRLCQHPTARFKSWRYSRRFRAEGSRYSTDLEASYELDFWGRNRDLVNSAQAAVRASNADRATVALTVTSAVANTYFQLLSLRERIAVARANLKSAQDILSVVQRRVTAGFSANADLIPQRAAPAAEQRAL